MAEQNVNNQQMQQQEEPQQPAAEKTFTQAELDTIVARRLAKAQKGMPSDEELSAFRAWKDSQQTEQQKFDAMKTERDSAKTELLAAQAKIE